MTGFTDLVDQAQPALYAKGASSGGTEGRTWRWTFTDAVDLAGDPIDFTAITGVCKILTAVGGSEVASLTFTGAADGSFTLSATQAETAGLYEGDGKRDRICAWSFVLSDGTESVQVWGPTNSRFSIVTED